TASLSALPALKPGFIEAAILISSPVRGLRPVRAARLRTSKVPKPTRVTLSPFFRALVMVAMTASTARPASARDRSAAPATASMNSALFIGLGSLCGRNGRWMWDRVPRCARRRLPVDDAATRAIPAQRGCVRYTSRPWQAQHGKQGVARLPALSTSVIRSVLQVGLYARLRRFPGGVVPPPGPWPRCQRTLQGYVRDLCVPE